VYCVTLGVRYGPTIHSCHFIYSHKNRTAPLAPIFTKLPHDQQPYVRISYWILSESHSKCGKCGYKFSYAPIFTKSAITQLPQLFTVTAPSHYPQDERAMTSGSSGMRSRCLAFINHSVSRVQLKCDDTRWRTGGEVKGKLANGVCSQYPSHYLGTWCIHHYCRWSALLDCQ